jgi:hypothetical protein
MMRKYVLALLCSAAFLIAAPAAAFAKVNPSTGQPGAPAGNTCGNAGTSTPGNSANAHGSPFNATGQAGNVYAGNPNTASLAHSNSTAAVSEYDIACFRP